MLPQGTGAVPQCRALQGASMHLLLLHSCGGSMCWCPASSQGQSDASYLTGVTLHQVELLKSLVCGGWSWES